MIAVFALVCVCWITMKWAGPASTRAFSDLASLTASCAATLCCICRSANSTGNLRRAWALLAAGTGSWALGQAGWASNELIRHIDVPYPSLSDVAFLALVPSALAGMAAMVTTRRGGLRTLLDGLIISGSLFYLSWALVLGPVYRTTTHSTLERVVSLAYPLGDLAIASMVFIMLGHADRLHRYSLILLALGFLALAVGDSGFAYLVQHDAYTTGNVVDTGWVNGFLLIAAAAILSPTRPPASREQDTTWWLILPYLPLAVALIASVVLRFVRGGAELILYLVELVIVVLVMLRQVLSLRDNVLLSRQLRRVVYDLRGSRARLEHLALHDQLTGLANRAMFTDRVEQAVAAQDTDGGHLGLLYVDLDGFKAVNDSFGHSVGDELLIAAADRLRGCTRAGDTLARLGGDEFALLATNLDDPTDGHTLAARIVFALAEPFTLTVGPIAITGSVGLAPRTPDGHDAGELLRQADLVMYRAKRDGKNRYSSINMAADNGLDEV